MLDARHPGPVAAAVTFAVLALVAAGLGDLWVAGILMIFAIVAWLFTPDEQDPERRRRIREQHEAERKYAIPAAETWHNLGGPGLIGQRRGRGRPPGS
jgi:hypothetical protein